MIERPLYLQKFEIFSDQKLIKIITGIRQSGKSSVMLLLRELLL